jgi:O-antigen/teichoic acid export membrane protein
VTVGDFLNACFRGVDRFETETRNVVLASGLHVVIVAPIAWFTEDWVYIAAAFFMSRSLYLLLSISSFKRLFVGVGTSIFEKDWIADAVSQIRISIMYAADSALVAVRSYADVFMISIFLGTNAVGLYQVGMNLVRAIENVGPIIANVYLPKLSSLLQKPQEATRYETQLLVLLLCCGLACFGVLSLLPEGLLLVVFGERYSPAFVLFPFFGLYLLTRFMAMALGVLLTARGFQANRALAGLVSLSVLLLCAWALMPFLGLTAVAVANVISGLTLVAWFTLRLRVGPLRLRDAVSAAVIIGSMTLITFKLIGKN